MFVLKPVQLLMGGLHGEEYFGTTNLSIPIQQMTQVLMERFNLLGLMVIQHINRQTIMMDLVM